jgi:nucleoside-diphosphate-sugar epimerase
VDRPEEQLIPVRAFVTGAGGFLGQRLVRELVSRGHAVRALLRSDAAAGALRSCGAEIALGDALDPAALRRGVEGCELVYHLAGIRRATRREEFFRVNVDSTRLLLDACEATGAAGRRFVLAGSLAASGPSAVGRREDEPFAPREWYGESKAEAERVAFAAAGRIPVAVARPPRVMGPGDRENLLFFRIAEAGWLLRIGGGTRPLSWIDVDDCARGFALLGEHPSAVGEAFFLASPDRTSVVGLQRAIANALGATVREVPVPEALLRGAAAVADLATRLTGRRLPLNKKLARQILAPGWACDTTKAREVIGFDAPTPLADSLARAAAAYRAAGWLRPPRPA